MEVLQCLLLAAVTVLAVWLQYEYWRKDRQCLSTIKIKIAHIRQITNSLENSSVDT